MTILIDIAHKTLSEDKDLNYMVDFSNYENTEIDEKLISVMGWKTLKFQKSWGKIMGSDLEEYENEYNEMIHCTGVIPGSNDKNRFIVFEELYEPSSYKTRSRFHLVEVSFEKAIEVGLWAQEKNESIRKEEEKELMEDAKRVMEKLEKELGFDPSEKMLRAIAFTLKIERRK
jgi:hypothetical protein